MEENLNIHHFEDNRPNNSFNSEKGPAIARDKFQETLTQKKNKKRDDRTTSCRISKTIGL